MFGSWKTDREMLITSIAVTYKCPAECNHCSAEQQKKGLDTLTDEEMERLIDEAKQISSVIVFTGGEPLLRKDIFKFINRARDVQTIVFTNGLYLTENICKNLAIAGLDGVMISLLADDPDEHDKIYKMPGLHDKALMGIQNALNAGLLVGIATCVTKKNIDQLEDIFLRAYTMGCHEINLREYVPTIDDDLSLLLDEEDWKKVDRLKEKYSRLTRPFACIDQRHMECTGGGKKIVSIDPYGNVLYCDFNPMKYGNIKDMPLKHILANINEEDTGKCKMKCEEWRKKWQDLNQ